MSYPKLTVLLTAAALTIPSCNQKQTEEQREKTEHTELSNTLQLKRGDMTKILKDSITQGNGTITTRNDTITQQNNNNSTNNFEAKNNDTSEVNKDIYTPLSENDKINFTKRELLERLLTVLAIGGTIGYLFGDYNNKANKMLKGNKSRLYGHIIGILSNSKLKDEIMGIQKEITIKIQEFQNLETDKTDTNYTKKYNEIKSLINELTEILEYINYTPDEIIEKTEKLVKRYSKFKELEYEYSTELTQYENNFNRLNDHINSEKRRLNITETETLYKILQDIKNGKIKYTETYKELFNLAEEYNSTETSKTKTQTLCDYLSEIEKTINPLFTLPQELAQEPTNSETE